jgi:hypothetical protein
LFWMAHAIVGTRDNDRVRRQSNHSFCMLPTGARRTGDYLADEDAI